MVSEAPQGQWRRETQAVTTACAVGHRESMGVQHTVLTCPAFSHTAGCSCCSKSSGRQQPSARPLSGRRRQRTRGSSWRTCRQGSPAVALRLGNHIMQLCSLL